MLFFLCLGLLMEYLQGFEPNRYSEVSDMVANTLGVLAALVLSRTRVRFMLVRLEQYITQ
jgi:VanZ family protein